MLATGEVVVDEVWKTFRIYQQRSSTLKQAILRRGNEQFEEFWALRGVSFEVPPGTTLGVIGANGAGKSTMLKVLARILVPDKGSVRMDGRVSALLELGAGFHPELTGRENVFLNGTILGMSQPELVRRFDEIVEFAGLEHAIDNAVKTYSSGMQARLGFSVAVSVEPDILIVDEVLAVGDEQFQRRSMERMNELRSGGRTAILVSHSLGQVRQICDHAVWLNQGQVAEHGQTEDVINAYLRSVRPNVRIDAKGREHQGSGEIDFDLHVLSEGQVTEVVEQGAPLEVQLDWTSNVELADLRFRFLIHAAEGHVIAGDHVHDEAIATVVPGSGRLVYSIRHLNLLPGQYHFSAAIVNRHSEHVYDSSPNIASLTVMPASAEFDIPGYVPLSGEWRRG